MEGSRRRLFSVYSWAIMVFLYLPILILVLYSFNDSRINAVWTGFTWKWYASLLENRHVMEAFSNSLTVAVSSSIIATVLGTLAALAMQRYSLKWRSLLSGLVYLPVIIPDVLMGLSLLVLFSQIGFPLGKLTMIAAHVTFGISFVVVIVSARLSGMGDELEEAAQDLGATPWQTFRFITLPVIAPGIVASLLLTFTMSLDDFIISFFVAGPNSTTLPLYIYGLVKRGVSPEVNALSTMLIGITVLLLLISEVFRRKGMQKDDHSQLPI